MNGGKTELKTICSHYLQGGESISIILALILHLEGQVLFFVHSNTEFFLRAVRRVFPCVLYYRSFRQIYPMNHDTISFHAGHHTHMKQRQSGAKPAFVTGGISKCMWHGQGQHKPIKRQISRAPQCR